MQRPTWRGMTIALALLAAGCGNGPAPSAGPADRVTLLLKSVPLIDGHNDLPGRMRNTVFYDFDKIDLRDAPQFHTDLPRLQQGMLGGQFWSVYVPASTQGKEAVRATMEQINAVYLMARRFPDRFQIVGTADEVEGAFRAGRIASMMGMEGGHSIDSSLPTLHMFYRLGVRYMTLTHSLNVPWADSATDTPKLGGLSKFGEAVVTEMNWLGMLVDLSHVSPDTMADALSVTEAPVIFSHSSARALCDVPRNVPDAILEKLPANGGVVMVSFVPGFTSAEVAEHDKAERAERESLSSAHPDDADAVTRGIEAWRVSHPAPKATLAQVADHIDHIRKVAGIDHIGIGSDFDGIDSVPLGLEDVSKYPALVAELVTRGYTDDDIRKILGTNVLRVMRRAEEVARRLQGSRQPSVVRLEDLDGPPTR